MAQKILKVFVGDIGAEVGTLWFEFQGNREHSIFQYAPAWLQRPRAFAISPLMPLGDERMFFRAQGGHSSSLPLPIADTTPDSWGRNIIRRDSKGGNKPSEPLTEIDYLTTVDDFSRIGALRFQEVDGKDFLACGVAGKHPIPPLLHLDRLSKDIISAELNEPDQAALQRLRQVGTSLGGARPKCSVIDRDGSLAIAKFTSRLDQYAVERAEVMTLNLAKRCGINTPPARLEMSADLPVAIIKRFDRSPQGRLAFISAQTMLGLPAATGSTYAEIADSLRQHTVSPKKELRELFQRVGFGILVSNLDDHLKNHGFLYAGNNKWSLSPAFDMNPAPERFRELKTAIASPSEPAASIELLLQHAHRFELEKDQAAQALRGMAQIISGQWVSLAKETGMNRVEINQYRPAFEHDELSLALREFHPARQPDEDDAPSP